MADKVSTIVLKVDLECSKCYNKVRKTLCQNHYDIRSQAIDRKAGTITITGPFDPAAFAKKLNSTAGKAIKSIEIKKKEEEKPKAKEAEKPKAKEADKPAADKPKAKEADKPAAEKPKPKEADKPAAEKPKQAEAAKADKPKEDKPKDDKPKKVTFDEAKSDPPKAAAAAPAPSPGPGMKFVEPGTVLAYPVVHPYGGYTVPCYEGYVGGGHVYDYGRPVGYEYGYEANTSYYANNGYTNSNRNNGSDYFSERDPSCTVM